MKPQLIELDQTQCKGELDRDYTYHLCSVWVENGADIDFCDDDSEFYVNLDITQWSNTGNLEVTYLKGLGLKEWRQLQELANRAIEILEAND